jgi:small basic protein
MAAYAAVAVVTVLVTLGLLATTKIPVVVTLSAATLVAGVITILGRFDLGYWDPFAPIAFVSLWFFAAIVSLAFIGVGRWFKWAFFLSSKAARPTEGNGAL